MKLETVKFEAVKLEAVAGGGTSDVEGEELEAAKLEAVTLEADVAGEELGALEFECVMDACLDMGFLGDVSAAVASPRPRWCDISEDMSEGACRRPAS